MFVFIVYAILGVNLFGVDGNFHGRCVVDSPVGALQGTQGLLQLVRSHSRAQHWAGGSHLAARSFRAWKSAEVSMSMWTLRCCLVRVRWLRQRQPITQGWLDNSDQLCGDGYPCGDGFRCSCKRLTFENGTLEPGPIYSFDKDRGCFHDSPRPWLPDSTQTNGKISTAVLAALHELLALSTSLSRSREVERPRIEMHLHLDKSFPHHAVGSTTLRLRYQKLIFTLPCRAMVSQQPHDLLRQFR